jgi:alkylhydroperoxidase family enzyme
MPRIEPVAEGDDPALAPLIEKIRRERGGKLLILYRMLLHSPPVAEGWLALLTAIRQHCSLSARLRELAILRIAVLNRADYEFEAHVPFALAEGVPQSSIDALRAGRSLPDASSAEAATLAYTEALTSKVEVSDATFAEVSRHLSKREVVELTATVGAYNMVSRFLVALRILPQDKTA